MSPGVEEAEASGASSRGLGYLSVEIRQRSEQATELAQRSGSADLPLHGGRVPKWLGDRMTRLGAVMCEAIIHHYGRNELLRRLAHPFWFQSFGAVMGMDWHSSGITTSVVGALKRGLTPLSGELGIHVCGGRGAHSRKTPHELAAIGERIGFDGTRLASVSRLVAKVDSAAVQDGFDLYLHGFIVTDDGDWVVVQQGMNGDSKVARRYHWLSEGLKSFVDQPHAAIEGANQGEIVNLTDHRAEASRQGQLDLLQDLGPDRILREFAALDAGTAAAPEQPMLPHLIMPAHHDVRESDIVMRRLHGNMAAAAERGPADFSELLLVPGVGARTVRALALVAEVVHGAPCRFSDPGRFSIAHGGKDRHPFPVPLKVYDETIGVLKSAVQKARLGREEEIGALKRLDDQSRQVERYVTGPSLKEIVAGEFDQSHLLGGRSVFGWEPPPDKAPTKLDKKA
ncbi:mlr6856 [Mesorhizobium japonicum MAFF 303099]|uniref:Mlr6856 protein n=1 Tax=Mesorhizobium japonicum (strain LMG 29417 / CECT 9101 / MAFF 303099) TaxID=266835 RepID=Q987Y3_RHILO|nr:mlr6856 [Mesorhizobium japonicum MAFF 303099]